MITSTFAKGLLALSALTVLCGNAETAARDADRDVTQEIMRYLSRATESGLFSGSVAITLRGKLVFNQSFGFADLAHDVRNTPETRFDIGSVSKTFTAALVLQLQDRGKVRLDSPICNYLSDCPDAWKAVSIRQLLNHTSGILNYTDLPDQYEMRALASFMPNAMTRIRAMPLQFRPGDRFSYSNTGYKLLHDIVERVTGLPYSQILKDQILNPLRLSDTGFLEVRGVRHLIVKELATGYTDGVGPLEVAPWVHTSYGGGMFGTARDMCAWGSGLLDHRVLSQQALQDSFTPGKGNYGYGWFAYNRAAHPFVTHGGNIPGFAANLTLYPADEVVIAVVSNLDTAPTVRVQEDIARIVFGDHYDPLPVWHAITIDPRRFDDYVGRYRKTDDEKFVITVTRDNDQLWNRLGDSPGAADMVLRPLSIDRFFNKMLVLYEVTFVRNERGLVETLMADGPWGHGTFTKLK
jgi:CubicO group peptidase (beta-lactamase class C family)